MRTKTLNTEQKDCLFTIIRRSNSLTDKYSAGGREKRRTRAIPSLPQLRCLQEDTAADPELKAKLK